MKSVPYSTIYSTYYEHKQVVFDTECQTIEEQKDCCSLSITKGKTSADFEAEKYIIMYDYDMFSFVVQRFHSYLFDWNHLFATILINQNSVAFLSCLLQYYYTENNKFFGLDASNHDILYLFHMFTSKEMKKDVSFTISIFCRFAPEIMQVETYQWERRNPNNPRNLVYALWKEDMETAMYLIEQGCCVDVWNNFPVALISKSPRMKTNSKLLMELMKRGAKLVVKRILSPTQFHQVIALREAKKQQQNKQVENSIVKINLNLEESQKRIRSNMISLLN